MRRYNVYLVGVKAVANWANLARQAAAGTMPVPPLSAQMSADACGKLP